MNDSSHPSKASVPRNLVEHIDQVCDRFEAAWQANQQPRIKDYLGLDPSIERAGLRRKLLAELVMIDLEYRWRSGAKALAGQKAPATSVPSQPRLADYVGRYPELGPLEELPDELIGQEYQVRQLWGDQPSHDQYLAQFGKGRPKLGDILAQMDQQVATRSGEKQIGLTSATVSEAWAKAAGRGSQKTDAAKMDNGSGAASKRTDSSAPGEYGNYRVLQSLAKGGMGRLSIAEDRLLHRKVVLKEILERLAENPASRRRFVAEAQITGQLEHPGIVPIYAFGMDRHGRPFYTMRRVRGRTLGKAIASYHLKPTSAGLRELLRRFIAVCQTMAYTHARGVIHRDLKPSNVMVGDFGETLLLDWGLAKPVAKGGSSGSTQGDLAHQHLHQFPKLTALGAKVGTAAYMAPEQAEAGAEQLGPAADIYGLGSILYQLLVGKPPYTGKSSPEILEKVRSAPPKRPSEVRPDVPRPLEAICLKAMARRSEERYSNAATLAADVQNWLDDEPVSAYPDPLLQRAWRWARHHKTATASVLVFLFTAVVAVAIGTVVTERQRVRTLAAQQRAEEYARQRDEAIGKAEEKEREAEQHKKEAYEERGRAIKYMEEAQSWKAKENATRELVKQLEAEAQVKGQELEDARAELRIAESRATAAVSQARIAQQKADKLEEESARLGQEAQRLRQLAAELSQLASEQEPEVELPQPEPSPLRDFTEGNEDRFDVVASDGAFSLLTSDWSRQQAGKGSLRVDTLTRDQVCVVYPSSRSADWDLSNQKYINLALFAKDGADHQMENFWVRIGRGSSYAEYQPDPATVAESRQNWVHTSIPLSGGDDWKRSDTNHPDLSHVDWIEVHASTSTTGLTFWLDDLGFMTEPVLSRVLLPRIPGPIPAPAKLPGIVRWQVDTVAPRGQIQTVAWSPDGKLIACGTMAGSVRIYDASTLRLVRVLPGHTWTVWSVAWSPDGKRLASASQDQTLRLWHVDGTPGPVFGKGLFWSLAWSPNGHSLASGCEDNTVRLWKADGTPGPVLRGHTGGVWSVAWSPDGKRLASGSEDNTVRLWQGDGIPGPVFDGHTGKVWCAAWSPDGRWIASGSADKTVRLWDASGKRGPVLERHTAEVMCVAWSPHGRRLASGSWGTGCRIRLWGADGTAGRLSEKHGWPGSALSLAWSPDGRRLVSAQADGIRVWAADGTLLSQLDRRNANVWSVAWSPDGGQLASASWDNSLRLWEPDGSPRRVFRGPGGYFWCVAWSSDGQRLASGHFKAVRLWQANGVPGPVLKGHTDNVLSVVWTPDGKRLASASRDKTVRLWDADGTPGPVLEGHTGWVTSVAWSPDGKRLASASGDTTVRLWEVDGTAGPVLEGHTFGVSSVAWSPDGQWLASGGGNTVRLWKPDSTPGPVLQEHPLKVFSVAWSPDGQGIACARSDGTVRLWGADGTPGPVFEGNGYGVQSLTWSGDGRWIAGGSTANTILLWDVDTGEPQWIALLLNDGKSVTFSPDGKEILHGDPKVIEKELVYLVQREPGKPIELLKPSEFKKLMAAGSGDSLDD